MRKTILGLAAAIAVMTAGVAPAMACGGGLFGSCSPCGQAHASPCGEPEVYLPPAEYSGCYTSCGWALVERLPDPELQYHSRPMRHQYYYVNQGPTFTGPGAVAPYPTYQEAAAYGWGYRHIHHHHYRQPVLSRYY